MTKDCRMYINHVAYLDVGGFDDRRPTLTSLVAQYLTWAQDAPNDVDQALLWARWSRLLRCLVLSALSRKDNPTVRTDGTPQ
jgi:hypothetical protein